MSLRCRRFIQEHLKCTNVVEKAVWCNINFKPLDKKCGTAKWIRSGNVKAAKRQEVRTWWWTQSIFLKMLIKNTSVSSSTPSAPGPPPFGYPSGFLNPSWWWWGFSSSSLVQASHNADSLTAVTKWPSICSILFEEMLLEVNVIFLVAGFLAHP